MQYLEALEYIHSINWQFCKPGLERVSRLCAALGNPHLRLRVIHVAGTNGKGSFCAMLDSVLRAQGYRVGLFTSPYILDFCERMRIDGENIPKDELCSLMEEIKPFADKMEDKPTEFELITALAFLYFAKHDCDFVILECGLGGRLDATNIIKAPLLSVITGIALDHTAILGDTHEKIAAEKAGIIKEKAPVLWCGKNADAEKVIKETAQKHACPFFKVDHEELSVKKMTLCGTELDFGKHKDITLSLLGTYQPRNASNVLCAIDILRNMGIQISDEAIKHGLSQVVWHARFELLCKEPVILADGGHNPEGIDCALESIKQYFPNQKVAMITGVMADKDYEYMAKKMALVAEKVFCVTSANPRALDSEKFAAVFEKLGVDSVSCGTVQNAVKEAISLAKNTKLPIVCLGSLYTYGEIAKQIKEELENNKI